MGRLEKIVVLTVVFLIAVILGVSLNETDVGDPVPDGSDPLVASRNDDVLRQPLQPGTLQEAEALRRTEIRQPDGMREVTPGVPDPRETAEPVEILRSNPVEPAAETQLVARPQVAGPQADESRDERIAALDHRSGPTPTDELRHDSGRTRLLNSAVRLEDGPIVTEDVDEADEAQSILVRNAGLTPTHDDQYMLYTWKDGDTFTSVARTYYDSMAHVRLLRLANEGRTERDLAAGDQILVPVFDPDGGVTTGRAYTVAEGDTLSSIAQKIYGDPSKYRKIFEANRDVLNDENTLALGQELRIPR